MENLRKQFTKEELERAQGLPITPEDILKAREAFNIANRRVGIRCERLGNVKPASAHSLVIAHRLFNMRKEEQEQEVK